MVHIVSIIITRVTLFKISDLSSMSQNYFHFEILNEFSNDFRLIYDFIENSDLYKVVYNCVVKFLFFIMEKWKEILFLYQKILRLKNVVAVR